MQEDAQMASLEELFEFIDCCVCPDVFSDSIDTTTPPTKPKRRRKRTGWSSSTGLQRRKRAELQFLREHVHDLEEYAERLQNRAGLPRESEEKDALTCDWQAMAAIEYAERQKAEELNRTLKRIMDKQLQVSEAFRLMAGQNALV
ncbi:uncharacterized protein PITG_09159 [Phytophthora infestans T30-4]|uniref:Uncharacterized protein n=1 Tax=Phytophthora infestans (strain T30-4) TaxID=403677 RepID=D0NBU5_PHYIT|nr:uncharacterized protein PITG_09159 [Phytophthora infestans T30-4]EEY55250.1 conserved hypothetical protein [Phytophthora infestans T30-4]|eukprot:XP_002903474.1 conserved hypothetical protein [Phytophthora infestans T30-4]